MEQIQERLSSTPLPKSMPTSSLRSVMLLSPKTNLSMLTSYLNDCSYFRHTQVYEEFQQLFESKIEGNYITDTFSRPNMYADLI